MKKIILVALMIVMISSVAFAQKAAIKEKDLAGLKGTWQGRLSFGLTQQAATANAKLEILNDAAPLKAKLTISNVPSEVASKLSMTGSEGAFENNNGVLTSQGTVMWMGETEKNFFEISKGKKGLNAVFYYMGVKGDASLVKK